MSESIIIFCTAPEGEKGKEIAEHLIQKELAACVNIVPKVQSVYRWKGVICTDAESLLIIKTNKHLFQSIEKEIRRVHPYEVPEIISVDITDGYKEYLDWIENSTVKR